MCSSASWFGVFFGVSACIDDTSTRVGLCASLVGDSRFLAGLRPETPTALTASHSPPLHLTITTIHPSPQSPVARPCADGTRQNFSTTVSLRPFRLPVFPPHAHGCGVRRLLCPRCRTPTAITTNEYRQTPGRCTHCDIATLFARPTIYYRLSSLSCAALSPNCALPDLSRTRRRLNEPSRHFLAFGPFATILRILIAH